MHLLTVESKFRDTSFQCNLYTVHDKRREISRQESFSNTLSRYYIFFTLGYKQIFQELVFDIEKPIVKLIEKSKLVFVQLLMKRENFKLQQ